MSDKPATRAKLLAIAPFFFVSTVIKMAGRYRDVLGFTVDRLWNGGDDRGSRHAGVWVNGVAFAHGIAKVRQGG
jgi:hypothetical protein